MAAQEPQHVSLNQVWPQFEEAVADEGELMTTVTLTLPDGRSAGGTLVVSHFEDEDGEDIRVVMRLDTRKDEHFNRIDITPNCEEGWTKETLIQAFNIDPHSPIWDVV
jgi:hypothetical protein